MSTDIDCPHCHRHIPADMVASYDMSGCPLAVPCVSRGHLAPESAWPLDDDDSDDDAERIEPIPVLSGGVA
jgi:hypothetical protein